MSEKSRKLKVEGLTPDITEDNLRTVLGNKRRLGGGPVESVELNKDGATCFAVVTFKESDAVDIILNRGDTVTINKLEARVKRFESCDKKQNSKACKKRSQASAHTSDDSASNSESESEKSKKKSDKSFKKKICPVKNSVSESSDGSRSNRKGSRVSILDSEDEEQTSLFDDNSDTESLLDKRKKKLDKESTKTSSKKKKPSLSKAHSEPSGDLKFSKKKYRTLSQIGDNDETSSSDDTSESELQPDKQRKKELASEKPKRKVQKSGIGVTKKKRSVQPSESSSDSDKEVEEEPWKTTIKANVIDVTKSKDYYQYYFEDPEIFQGQFYEDSLMLDGLNKNIYVMFHTKKAASATCRFKHKPDSNLSKVEMATKEDFNTYSNLLSVHGHYSFDTAAKKGELKAKVAEKTGFQVLDLFQYDEPRSAIIVFDPKTCQDVSAATWIRILYGQTCLIVAPVFKVHCVKVSGINSLSSDDMLRRYFINPRSGGGKISGLSRLNKNEAIITFKNEESVDGVLNKSNHELEGSKLHVSHYYPCLSKETYKQLIEPMQSQVVKATEADTQLLAKSSDRQWQPRGQTSAQRPASHRTLTCAVVKLCNFSKSEHINKRFQYTLELCNFGFQFLKSHEETLDELMQSVNCKQSLLLKGSRGVMIITLDWPEKITAPRVREMLKNGVDKTLNYLNTFRVAQFIIDKSEIHDFQNFCQVRSKQELPGVGLFFDHEDSVAVLISDCDETWIKNKMNDLYHNFLSCAAGPVEGSGHDVETRMLQNDGDDRHLDNRNKGKKVPPVPRPKTWKTKPPQDKDEKDEGDYDNKELTFEDYVDLDDMDIILFQQTNFHKDLEKENKPLKVIFDSKKPGAIIKSNDKNKVDSAVAELLKKTRDFKLANLQGIFSEQQVQLLRKQNVQDKINKEFKEKGFHAHFRCDTNTIALYHVKSVDDICLKEVVKSHVVVKDKPLDEDMVLALQSEKGRKFLSELCESNDGVKVCSFVELQPHGKKLLIITSAVQLNLLISEVNRFIEENKRYEKRVSFSSGKQKYAQKYKKREMEQIEKSLAPLGAEIKKNAEDIVVQGLKDGVSLGEKKLSEISEKIVVEDITLNFFGIKEFLQAVEGRDILKNVQTSKKCIILPKTDSQQTEGGSVSFHGKPALPEKPSKTIARAKFGDCIIEFLQGNITGLDAEVIVNPIEASLKCQTGLGKALVSKGGQIIQTELISRGMNSNAGAIVQTTAGNLDRCKTIIHVVCPTFSGSEMDTLEGAVAACLKQITSEGHKSMATPALGTGKKFKFPPVVACGLMMKSLHQHLAAGESSLRKIYLCDVKADLVRELIERFKNAFDLEVEQVGELKDSPVKASPIPAPRASVVKAKKVLKDYRNIKVSCILGEISKQQTDVIVVSVSKNLDLSKGRITKSILKYGGDELQEELRSNYSDGINPEEFAKTSGGNLKCRSIFYVCLHHWRPNNESHMSKVIYKLLEGAAEQQSTSMSIPAIGTGNLGYPADVAADVITDTISQFAKDNPKCSLKTINLVVFPRDTDVVQAFQEVVEGRGGRRSSPDEERYVRSDGDRYRDRSGHKHGSSPRGSGQNEMQFGSVKLSIKKGDIAAEKCDAIMSGVRNTMDLSKSGAVCKALLSKCGSGLQDECFSKKDEMEQNGFVATSAPNLNCKQIYHVSMDMFSRSWDKCIAQVLSDAESQGLTSIAMPALGSGAKRADSHRIKKAILSGVKQFSADSQGRLRDVRLVIFSQDMFNEFVGEGASFRHSPRNQEDNSQSHGTIHVSDSAVLRVYADSYPSIVSATKELKDFIGKAFKEDFENNKEVKRLDRHQVKQLETEGSKHCVQVLARIEEGLIIMKGFKAEDFLHVQKLLKNLLVDAIENHHKSLHKAVVSAFQWQFRQSKSKWRDFEPILNSELEGEFKKKSSHYDIVDSRGRKYRVDFSSLKEYSLDESGQAYGNGIDVRRYDRTKEGEALPKNWDKMGDSENLKLVPLQPESPEYKYQEQLFIKGGANMPIKKIQRVQNKVLYQLFKAKKREMDQRNGKDHKNEKKLFHGTDAASVTAINENGFNRSYCGKNATAYGKGVYFAENSSYSVNYATPSLQGDRSMYIVRVLTGISTPSNAAMNFLPNQPGKNVPFDSGCASGIFIIFHDAQAYPEYLITF